MDVKLIKTLCCGMVLSLMVGCSYFVSWEDNHDAWIGYPIGDYIKHNGPPDEIKNLDNGKKEYKYWLKRIDPSCIHYWIIDSKGIITGYHYEGSCGVI